MDEPAQRDPRLAGMGRLFAAARRPPPGRARLLTALALGALCHLLFAAAVLTMMVSMFFGLTRSPLRVPWPAGGALDLCLLLQFPAGHSLLLTRRGGRVLAKLLPNGWGGVLSTTSYASIASAQLLAVFVLWSPTGRIWWRAEGPLFPMICLADAIAWTLLAKAIFDAGVEVQSGALGWLSLAAGRRPVFPDMPTLGLFRLVRQPIYAAFALTLWTTPVWTPDQLVLALVFTTYCLLAPRLKEKRFLSRYGRRFEAYRRRTPYMAPRFRARAPGTPMRRFQRF